MESFMYRLRAELLGDIDRVFWGNQQHFFYFTLNWEYEEARDTIGIV